MSRGMNQRQRRKLIELLASTYGTRCAKCGKLIDLALYHPHKASPTIGHQLPLNKGGSDHIENLRLEHLSCNSSAGDRLAPVRRISYETAGYP